MCLFYVICVLFLLRHLHISAIKLVDNSDELLSKYLIVQAESTLSHVILLNLRLVF